LYMYRLLFNKNISIKLVISSIVTMVTYLLIRVSVLGAVLQKMHLIPISEISLWQRIGHIPAIVFYYLHMFFFPDKFAIDQIWIIPKFNFSSFYLPLIVDGAFFATIIILIYVLGRKAKDTARKLVFFGGWFIAGMAFLLQIFPLDMTVADRWFYFPGIGLVGLLGLFAVKALGRHKKFAYTIALIILAALAVRTIERNANWYSPLTLYSHDVQAYPNYDIENYLGAELAGVNKNSEAISHFLRSVELLPHDTNIYNVGSMYERVKDYPNAIAYYRKTLEFKSNYTSHAQIRKLAFEGLIRLLIAHDRPEVANPVIKQAVEEFPKNGTLWGYLAINEYGLHNQAGALSAAEKAKTYFPNATTNQLYELIVNKKPIDLIFN
jgi:tetratricopeptide (TPR) repeat protein